MRTIAAHKPCRFQQYRLEESMGGRIWEGVVDRRSNLPNLTPIGAFVFPCGAKTEEGHFNIGSFLSVFIEILPCVVRQHIVFYVSQMMA